MPLDSCIVGHRASKSSRDQKVGTIAHENGQKCPKSRVLMMPLESCSGGHRASKSSQDPKVVDYSHENGRKMHEITIFDDAARFVHRGSQGIEILPRPERGVRPHPLGPAAKGALAPNDGVAA